MNKYELVDNENLINQTCLFNSRPIVLNRDLAIILGDSDLALIFQQIHYWITINKQTAERNISNINTYHEGRFWCFQTYDQWEKEFEWISYRTLRRKFQKLEQLGLIIAGNFNKMNLDKTKWYTINYKKLLELQNEILPIKLSEKEMKKNIRKEKEKIATKKFKNNKKSNFSEMAKMDITRNVQNGHLQMAKMDIAIQKNNIQEINYKQENKVSQSVNDKEKEELNNNRQTDGQNESGLKILMQNLELQLQQNKLNDNSEKEEKQEEQKVNIEFKENENELENIIIQTTNDLLNQKTVTVGNKKMQISKIIDELKSLNQNQKDKLISYVAKKFASSNQNIKNQRAYISSIFVNAIFEKSYLLDSLQTGSSYSAPTKQYKMDNFVNYEQPQIDFKKLREYEIKSLKGEI